MKVLKILIIAALILFPFGELLRFEVGNNIVLKPLDVVVGVAAVVFFAKNFPFSRFHFPFKPILLFAFVGLVSLLINLTWLTPIELLASSFYLLRWISYAALLPIVTSFEEKFKKKLLVFLFIDGLIIVVAGFLQYFFYNSLKDLYHLGWDEHMHRMFSVFFDPNFAGIFFVLFFLFVGGLLFELVENKSSRLAKARSKNKYLSVLLSILALTLIAVFMSFSRGALLSLLAGSAVFLILIKRMKLFFALLGVMALFVTLVSPQFYDENMNLFRTASSKARIVTYETAFKIIQDHPLLGVGFNSYRYAKESYGLKGGILIPSHADAGVDNSFLFVLTTTGIIGFIAYCSLLIAIVRKAYGLHKKGSVLATVVIASGVALCVNALFINSLFFAPLMLWMWMLVGLMEN